MNQPIMRNLPHVPRAPEHLDGVTTDALIALAATGGYRSDPTDVLRDKGLVTAFGAARRRTTGRTYRAFAEQLATWTLEQLRPSGRAATVVCFGDRRCGTLDVHPDGTSTLDGCSLREVPHVLAQRIGLTPRPPAPATGLTTPGLPTQPDGADVEHLAVLMEDADLAPLAEDIRHGRWLLWSMERAWDDGLRHHRDRITVLDTPAGMIRTDALPGDHDHLDWRGTDPGEVWARLADGPSMYTMQIHSADRRRSDGHSPHVGSRLVQRRPSTWMSTLGSHAQVHAPTTPEADATTASTDAAEDTGLPPVDDGTTAATSRSDAPPPGDVGPTWLDEVVDPDDRGGKGYRLY